ncbi:hypothetical protein [Enterobacter ludwigii]|uniref:hypothetical protein n=1 Tax=Enterobacter ludwigii TaxID=299767 RepID=UPI003B9E731C
MAKPIKHGCIRHITNGMRVLIDLKSVAAIRERTETADKVEVHLTSGEVFELDVAYEEIAGLYLEFLAKERGVMANPTSI